MTPFYSTQESFIVSKSEIESEGEIFFQVSGFSFSNLVMNLHIILGLSKGIYTVSAMHLLPLSPPGHRKMS